MKDTNEDQLNRLSWFEKGKSINYIRQHLEQCKNEIRIATGFFTIRGWELIRVYTKKKKIYILVGLEDPGKERARTALINDIMQDLRTGFDKDRRKSVQDLVNKIQSKQFGLVDARARDHHNKLYIFDKNHAIQTSSNLTGKGLIYQVEGGNIINDRKEIEQLILEFDEYFENAEDLSLSLLNILLKWLELCTPWHIYLKTLLALESLKPVKTTYSKQPLIYQKDMISLTLSQIHKFGGSMLVASTGLGKTVIGTLVAIQLKHQDLIDKIIVICPNAVKNSWSREMQDASLCAIYLTVETLDKKEAEDMQLWEDALKSLKLGKSRFLLIFDESHKLRKRYPDNYSNKYEKISLRRERKAFSRIKEFVNNTNNVKVLLLTGSPYATDIENINVQLHLLPHTSQPSVLLPEYFDDGKAWKIKDSKDFINLPVAHQLTTPHVAKYYAQLDENGRYIKFADDKKYFPNVILYTIQLPLLLEEEISYLISKGFFDLKISNPIFRKNIVTQVKKSWASSPLALQYFLEKIVNTPNGENSLKLEKSEFVINKSERGIAIKPIIQKLKKIQYEDDQKLQALIKIINYHSPEEKIVIFCELYPTVFYLEKAIKELNASLRVFATIEEKNNRGTFVAKTLKKVEKAIELFAPVANNINKISSNTYDIFITTDNYGIGVNMQDAAVVVNYDIAWTPIEPIQRAGRILRLWEEFRTVKIYTFIPIISKISELEKEVLQIERRWQNLMQRHKESKEITDLPVITAEEEQEISMPDFASDVSVQRGILSLDSTDDTDISVFYQHMQNLHLHREEAEKLNHDLVSAMSYKGKDPLIYMLLLHNHDYKILIYNSKSGRLDDIMPYSPDRLLNLIQCSTSTPIALVDTDMIEEVADIAIKKWCFVNRVNEFEVARECTLYLQPKDHESTIKEILY